jgi:hypothetical protein
MKKGVVVPGIGITKAAHANFLLTKKQSEFTIVKIILGDMVYGY